MRRVLIVAPHFVPSNLASVHRSRLFAAHLKEFGWEPIILTAHPDFYEEKLDPDLGSLIQPDLRIERVRALPVRPVRLVGDIGVRSFVPMLKRILALVDQQAIDFLYITVPSHFSAPLGRIVHLLRGVPYGIDYIDPWVHVWPGSEVLGTKHWLARKLGEWLEPFAVKRASLITGVAERYFRDVLIRNPDLAQTTVTAAMPYGGEHSDHAFVRSKRIVPRLFAPDDGLLHIVYAGAMLPRAYSVLEQILSSISARPSEFEDVQFHFIGTGTSPNDPSSFSIKPIAQKYGLWETVIHESPARIPYLEVLAHLEAADGVFILGSTEPHYTPSKVYQAVLSRKPIMAVLHAQSTACSVIRETRSGVLATFETETEVRNLSSTFADRFASYRTFMKEFDPDAVDLSRFEEYSATNVTRQLAAALTLAISRSQAATGHN